MGIRNLMKFIKEFAPGAMERASLADLRGLRVALDASIFVYQWHHVERTWGARDVNEKYTHHIRGAFALVAALVAVGATPVFVFDGPPPACKAAALAKREPAARVPREVFEGVMELLRLMKIPIVVAAGEAEAQAAWLAKGGFVDIVATEDTDAIVFGAPRVARGLSATGAALVIVDRAKLITESALGETSFVDLCILLGSDYTGTLPGIGYKRAIALIKKHGSIEKVMDDVPKVFPCIAMHGECGELIDFDYAAARAEFDAPVVDIMAGHRFTVGVLDVAEQEALRAFLVGQYGVSMKRVSKYLEGRL